MAYPSLLALIRFVCIFVEIRNHSVLCTALSFTSFVMFGMSQSQHTDMDIELKYSEEKNICAPVFMEACTVFLNFIKLKFMQVVCSGCFCISADLHLYA